MIWSNSCISNLGVWYPNCSLHFNVLSPMFTRYLTTFKNKTIKKNIFVLVFCTYYWICKWHWSCTSIFHARALMGKLKWLIHWAKNRTLHKCAKVMASKRNTQFCWLFTSKHTYMKLFLSQRPVQGSMLKVNVIPEQMVCTSKLAARQRDREVINKQSLCCFFHQRQHDSCHSCTCWGLQLCSYEDLSNYDKAWL